MFSNVFRKGKPLDPEDFESYVEQVFLRGPYYSEAEGSLVYEMASGRIGAALLILPMQVTANGRVLTGRLLTAFMKDPCLPSAGSARISLRLRAKLQDFCFSDTAAPVSASLTAAGGGEILPVQTLQWRRIFRPVGFLTANPRKHFSRTAAVPLKLAAPLIDRLARLAVSSLAIRKHGTTTTEPMDIDRFRDQAVAMIERFSVRPTWSKDEFDWLVGLADRNPRIGKRHCRAVVDGSGATIGACLYFVGREKVAHVFNLVSLPGRESDVVAALFEHFDSCGCVAAHGMAQPFLMTALGTQRYVSFRHRGHFCLLTKHADVIDAVRRHDIYIGGLASEAWSRLLTDFR
ncbi:GNAT family N-acetyltransferase [Stappia sp. F7233]|uniref:GNAT family N-acetyltransferase n=1 Tax=Stappia albiluteola TaxID=2758565 RepID=A0A839AB17_9HYPH|nr:GNAT family N-acetyltransferase [Stappia albiluteola]MBA5776142.1 GNAT family N-acetyltransferase [Stappia albiluteola]